MTDGDKIARLRLIRSERIGPVTYFQLLNRFGSAEAALSALPDLARRGGGKAPRIATKADAEREMAAVEKAGAKQLFLGLPPYPNLLAELEDARSEEHTSELQSLMRSSYAVFCLKKKTKKH